MIQEQRVTSIPSMTQPFADEVHAMADFVEAHPTILGATAIILAREPMLDGLRPDFLAWDTRTNTALIVELKNHPASSPILLQTLKYADQLRCRPDIVRYHLDKRGFTRAARQLNLEWLDICVVAPKIMPDLLTLSQYIAPFHFRFIELKASHTMTGQAQVFAELLDAPQPSSGAPGYARETYSLAAYARDGVRPAMLSLLRAWLSVLQPMAAQAELHCRFCQRVIRFQTLAGETAFALSIRKTRSPILALHLGEVFDTTGISADVLHRLRYSKAVPGVWQLELTHAPHRLPLPTVLLDAAMARAVIRHQSRESV